MIICYYTDKSGAVTGASILTADDADAEALKNASSGMNALTGIFGWEIQSHIIEAENNSLLAYLAKNGALKLNEKKHDTDTFGKEEPWAGNRRNGR